MGEFDAFKFRFRLSKGRAGALGLAAGPAAAGDSIAMDVLDEEEDEEAIMATEGEEELGPPPLLLAVGAGLAREGSAARAGSSGDGGGGSRAAAEGTTDDGTCCCVGDCTAGRDLWSGTCGGESPLLRLILGKSQGRS